MRAITLTIILTLVSLKTFSQKTTGMDKSKNYSVEIIRYNIPTDQRTNFEEAYSSAGAILKSSSYCLAYEIIHGVDEPQHYIVRIHWTSADDHINGFRKSKEFMAFYNLVKPFYNNIEEMKHYETTVISWSKP
jgi:heme-degrading monooxygenase HmoA